MRKIGIILMICVLCCTLSNIYVFAYSEDTFVNVSIPTFDITVNDVQYDSRYSEYPFLIYNDITYMPMTYDFASFMGINITFEKGVNYVYHKDEMILHIGYSKRTKNELGQYIRKTPNDTWNRAIIPDYHTYISMDRKEYDNMSLYPVLNFKGITYLPLTWCVMHTKLDWDYSFDHEKGLVIDSTKAIRPNGVNRRLFSRMATDSSEYICGEHYYLSYGVDIYTGGGFQWVTEDGYSEYNFTEELRGKINYFNRMYVNGALVTANPKPQIVDGILTIVCAKKDFGIENLMVTIDLNKGEVIQIDKIPLS